MGKNVRPVAVSGFHVFNPCSVTTHVQQLHLHAHHCRLTSILYTVAVRIPPDKASDHPRCFSYEAGIVSHAPAFYRDGERLCLPIGIRIRILALILSCTCSGHMMPRWRHKPQFVGSCVYACKPILSVAPRPLYDYHLSHHRWLSNVLHYLLIRRCNDVYQLHLNT